MISTLINDKDASVCGGTAIALMREWQLCLCFPGVILNPVRDDLRMMASKPVAAKDGAMKQNRKGKRFMLGDASIASHPDPLPLSCPIDRPLNARQFPARRLPRGQLVINQRSMYEGGKEQVFHYCAVMISAFVPV